MLQHYAAGNTDWSPLIQAGRSTRFGAPDGPCPSKTSKKHNYRRIQSITRRMGAAPVPKGICKRKITAEDMLKATYPPVFEITALHYMVAKMFAMALNGCVKSQYRIEIIIDGPVPYAQ